MEDLQIKLDKLEFYQSQVNELRDIIDFTQLLAEQQLL